MTKEFDKPAHFIAASSCGFGMCTVVNERYIVSSVGDYRHEGLRQRIGAGEDEFYETYVFKFAGKYCEIPNCPCGGLPEPSDWCEIDGRRAATEAACRDLHAHFVAKYGALP